MVNNGISPDLVAELICQAAQEVFATMLDMELAPGEPFTEDAFTEPFDGLICLIGLAGTWVGTGSTRCDEDLACELYSRLLLTEAHGVDREVLDAIGEVANMVIGNLKTSIEERLGPMGMSIPTVIYGRNFTTSTMDRGTGIVVPFLANGRRFDVKVCLLPGQQRSSVVRAEVPAVGLNHWPGKHN